MRKVDQNKKQKKDSLLDAAFGLFMENGFHKTSISDIVNQAGVAKGTFYLYFTDKYDLRNKLISHKAIQVFSNAYNALLNTEIKAFEEQIIFIIDHILTQFQKDHSLVFFIISSPSISGSPRSSSTRSGREDVIRAIPSLPLAAVATLYSLLLRVLLIKSRMLFSSSIIKTDTF